MIRLIRTELLKLRTTRVSYGLLAAAIAMTALEAILTAVRAGSGGPQGIPGLGTTAGLTAVVTSTDVAILLAMAFGAIVSSGEFRHGTATVTYLATPDRNRVLLAKSVAAAGAGLLLGLAAAAVATGTGLAFAAATLARFGAGATLAAGLLAAARVALGSLVRQQLGAIITVFAWGLLADDHRGNVPGPNGPGTSPARPTASVPGGAGERPFGRWSAVELQTYRPSR
jgi:ABC-2 type transport system permease protein